MSRRNLLAGAGLTQAILSRQGQGVSLSHPGVPGAVLSAGFVLVVVALTGVALGAAIRHTAGAIALLPAVFYLPLTLLWLPSPWNHRIDRFTLPVAAYQVVALHPATNLLAPALSMLVLIAWPASPAPSPPSSSPAGPHKTGVVPRIRRRPARTSPGALAPIEQAGASWPRSNSRSPIVMSVGASHVSATRFADLGGVAQECRW